MKERSERLSSKIQGKKKGQKEKKLKNTFFRSAQGGGGNNLNHALGVDNKERRDSKITLSNNLEGGGRVKSSKKTREKKKLTTGCSEEKSVKNGKKRMGPGREVTLKIRVRLSKKKKKYGERKPNVGFG